MFSKCLLRHDVVRVCVSFCTGHFVMVPLNMTYLHCLQHSLFEHLFNFYYLNTVYLPQLNEFNNIIVVKLCKIIYRQTVIDINSTSNH